VTSLFAAVLGINPLHHLLSMGGILQSLPADAQHVLTGREYFPHLLSGPFSHGLTIVFSVSAGLAFISAIASMTRGARTTRTTAISPSAEGEAERVEVGAGHAAGSGPVA
jgi:hypothetical protein